MSAGATTLVGRSREWLRTPESRKLVRYATVSVISTVLSLILLYVFYRGVGLSPAWANIVTTVIVTVPNYYLNRAWAWGRTGKSHVMREVVPFWVIAFISLALSTGAVVLAHDNAHYISHSKMVQTGLVEFANFFTYGVMWIGKYTIFNKLLFRHHGATMDDESDGGAPEDGEPIVLVPATAD
jgi:putative flippase GtrA